MSCNRLRLEGRMLTRSVTPEQIRRSGERMYRTVELREVSEEDRTAELSFSSETPVRRWFGDEVLSHEEGSMRTERLEASGPLLVNHDPDDQVGVVESVRIEERRGRAVVRFGRSTRADEIFRDVIDGIRRNVSVGYIPHGVSVEEREGEPDLVTLTDWEPLEITLASVPADIGVGVGRSAEMSPEDEGQRGGDTSGHDPNSASNERHQEPEMKEKILRDGKGNLVRAKVDENDAIVEVLETIERAGQAVESAQRQGAEAEQTRVRSVLEMGEQYGAPELARTAVQNGRTVEQFRAELLEHMNSNRGGAVSQGDGGIGMSDGETRRFSFLRALRALSNPTDRRAQEAASFEFEASAAAADRMGRDAEGIVVPPEVLSRALNTSTGGAQAGDTGGNAIDTTLMTSSFIDLLRNRAVAMRLGTSMGGLVGNFDIPKQTAGASGYWIGEDEDATEDILELGQVGLRPKTVAALSEVTRRMLMQTSMDVEALVRSDLATALALTIDKAFFYGTGAGNQPLGIVNTNGINAVNFGTTAKPTYSEIVDMESQIAADNADVEGMAYVMNSNMRGYLKTTEKFDGSNGATIWESGGTVNGYGAEVTNQINSGDVVFGNFVDALIGMWGGLELTSDPYTHSSKGRLRIVAMQDVDFVLRRIESFCLGRNSS